MDTLKANLSRIIKTSPFGRHSSQPSPLAACRGCRQPQNLPTGTRFCKVTRRDVEDATLPGMS